MYKFWITAVMVYSSLCLASTQASAANVFSYAQINVPFEVRVNGTWAKVIENREAWEAFYKENAGKYLAPESELNNPPLFDFGAYTVIAGGLGEGGAGRSLMIENVRGGSTTYVGALVLLADSSCNVTANVTYPTMVILIPKPQGKLQLNSREAVFSCK
ncbi:MAG: hypothetical protein V4751_04610 [Pseudomonadota bacterium]